MQKKLNNRKQNNKTKQNKKKDEVKSTRLSPYDSTWLEGGQQVLFVMLQVCVSHGANDRRTASWMSFICLLFYKVCWAKRVASKDLASHSCLVYSRAGRGLWDNSFSTWTLGLTFLWVHLVVKQENDQFTDNTGCETGCHHQFCHFWASSILYHNENFYWAFTHSLTSETAQWGSNRQQLY